MKVRRCVREGETSLVLLGKDALKEGGAKAQIQTRAVAERGVVFQNIVASCVRLAIETVDKIGVIDLYVQGVGGEVQKQTRVAVSERYAEQGVAHGGAKDEIVTGQKGRHRMLRGGRGKAKVHSRSPFTVILREEYLDLLLL